MYCTHLDPKNQDVYKRQHMGLPGKGIHMADKQVAGLPAQKAHIVAVPAIGNGRAVGDDEHRLWKRQSRF